MNRCQLDQNRSQLYQYQGKIGKRTTLGYSCFFCRNWFNTSTHSANFPNWKCNVTSSASTTAVKGRPRSRCRVRHRSWRWTTGMTTVNFRISDPVIWLQIILRDGFGERTSITTKMLFRLNFYLPKWNVS